MKISIVIPNFNGKALLENNLPKVFEALEGMGKNAEVIIVDDFSSDNSVNFIQNLIKKNTILKLIKNDKNLGFSSSVNKGVKNALGEIVVLLNTDVYPQKDFLEPLLIHFADKQVFAVGCMDKSMEADKIVLRGRGLGSWQRGFLVHRLGIPNSDTTLWVSGGSSAFRKSIWDKLGGLNTLYNPFYWEDIDLSYRALKSGYKIIFESKSIVYHEHDKGIIKNKFSKTKVKRIAYRNQIMFAWLNASDVNLRISNIFWFFYHCIKTIFSGDLMFVLGFFDALILLPKIIKSRLNTYKNFVVTDKQVIESL